MAVRCTDKLHYSYLFIYLALCVLFGKSTGALTSTKSGLDEIKYFRSFPEEPTVPPPGVSVTNLFSVLQKFTELALTNNLINK